uniref:Uncharacterized protein n=1 Tax=Arundo donax TaxID=35708 RepID=A0A0A9BZV0_ARUDO
MIPKGIPRSHTRLVLLYCLPRIPRGLSIELIRIQ